VQQPKHGVIDGCTELSGDLSTHLAYFTSGQLSVGLSGYLMHETTNQAKVAQA